MVPGVEQQWHQALANGARGSCQENLHGGISLLATLRDRAGIIRQTSVHPPSTHAVPANAEPPAPPSARNLAKQFGTARSTAYAILAGVHGAALSSAQRLSGKATFGPRL